MTINDIKIRNAYSQGNDLIFTYKDNDIRKKFVITNFMWYCVILTKDWIKFKNKLELSGVLSKVEDGKKYTKLYADKDEGSNWSDSRTLVKILREYKIETFEADLHSAKRFMVDNDVDVDDKYDILYFDIETDDSNMRIEIGHDKIIAFGAVDNNGNEFYFNGDENIILSKVQNLFGKYDVVTGWNIDQFDIPYLEMRWQVYNNSKFIDWIKLAKIDMLKRLKRLFQEDASLKSYKLENIAQKFLNKGKIQFQGKIINMTKEELKAYNLNDVYILKELDDKIGIFDLIGKECSMAKCLIRDFAGIYVSQILDSMILKEAHLNKIYCPSKREVRKDPYAGGLVLDPDIGLHKNVYVFDFKSLYPSIIMTFNLGFDTISDSGIKNPGTNLYFSKDKESIISKVVRRLIEERQSYKRLRLDLIGHGKMNTEEFKTARANEIIVKELSNSIYGVLGNHGLRYYSLDIAKSITLTGQWLLKFSKDYFDNINGLKTIYGDTDSIFVKSDRELDINDVLSQYHKKIKFTLSEYNVNEVYITLKYEKLFSEMILVNKKTYAGRIVNIENKTVAKSDQFKAVGLEIAKKATLPMVLKSQRSLIEMVLDDYAESEIRGFLSQELNKINNDKFTFDELKISTQLGKNINDYVQTNAPHVRLAKKIIDEKGELESSEIEYVVLNNESKIFLLKENFKEEFDRHYYWNNKIFPPLLRILEASHSSVNWLKLYGIPNIPKRLRVSEGQLLIF